MRKGSLVQLTVLGLIYGAITTAIAVFIPWLPPSASKQADRIDFLYWLATIICIVVFSVVAAVMTFSLLKFRAGPDDDSDGKPIHGHTMLEVVWTLVPTVLVTLIGVVSAVILVQNGRAGSNPLNVRVDAEQFNWEFTYESGPAKGITSNVLNLPRGQAVKLELHALDVIHSFWVPEFAQKQDAVPGTVQHLVITPTKDGTYPVICTELCGLGHATMRTSTVVMEPAAFEKWAADQTGGGSAGGGTGGGGSSGGGGSAGGGSAAGLAAFTNNGCGACHTLTAAKAAGQVGPDLDKLPAEAKKAGQPLEGFVRESIVNPNAYVEPGYSAGVMPPSFGQQLSKADLEALVQYLIQSSKGGK